MPGNLGNKLQGAQIDEKAIAHTEAIILSMTPQERANVKILNGSRRKRIAQGAGVKIQDVNRMMKQFADMQKTMKKMKGMNPKKLNPSKLGGLGGLSGMFRK